MSKFSSENQPRGRGKSFKSKLIDVIREESLLDLSPSAGIEATERAFIKHLALRAFNLDDKDSNTLLKELINKTYPTLKAALPEYKFDLPEDSTPARKAEAVFSAIAEGNIPPDVGNMLIQAAKGMVEIELGTEVKARIEAIEKELGIDV